MLSTFQIILSCLTVIFSLGLLAEDNSVNTYENKNRYLSIVLASVIALTVTFFIGG